MNSKKKTLLLVVSAVLLVVATVFTTMAYLTSQDEVINTFTVGNVEIILDEADANTDGTLVDDGKTRVDANEYHLLPGHTYAKDPMVTVKEGSESAYIRMKVTFNISDKLDEVFPEADLTTLFNGYDSGKWVYKGNVEDNTAHTRTYEFWYKEAVAAPKADVALDALFDSITVPGGLTNDQLAKIEGMTITVNAEAIQADGFADAAAAWAAFPVTP